MKGKAIDQIVTFTIEKEVFGLSVRHVKEIIVPRQIQTMTTQKKEEEGNAVIGVINLRNVVIPILDFRLLLRKNKKEDDKLSRIIILTDEQTSIGLLVDKVVQVSHLDENTCDRSPACVNPYVYSVSKTNENGELVYLLDAKRLWKQVEGEQHAE